MTPPPSSKKPGGPAKPRGPAKASVPANPGVPPKPAGPEKPGGSGAVGRTQNRPPAKSAGRPRTAAKVSSASARSPEEAHARLSPARRVAFEILTVVGHGRGHSDELLHGPRTHALSPEDRNLATALVMGVLRWQIALDARIRTLLERPDQRLVEPVALALRLGAFQLLHLDRIPAHAALSESVELCRAAGHAHATGMVNAILRKVAAAQKPQPRIFESVAAFAERLGHPLWLTERWVAHYGRDAALKICEAGQHEPEAGTLFHPPASGDPDLPQMDDGSRLVAELAAAALPAVTGRPPRIWDCCAAPGGKTLILALRHPGADLLATDISPRRLTQTQARLNRFGYAASVRLQPADAAKLQPNHGFFDLILCDAPCSGTGTLSRNPEIRLQLRPEELARQAIRQRAILEGAVRRLAPGGVLVYATCSLEPEENEAVVASLVGAGLIPIDASIPLASIPDLADPAALAQATSNGILRTLPGVHPCDGFYAAIYQRPAPNPPETTL